MFPEHWEIPQIETSIEFFNQFVCEDIATPFDCFVGDVIIAFGCFLRDSVDGFLDLSGCDRREIEGRLQGSWDYVFGVNINRNV
jgi:hypothetical protein